MLWRLFQLARFGAYWRSMRKALSALGVEYFIRHSDRGVDRPYPDTFWLVGRSRGHRWKVAYLSTWIFTFRVGNAIYAWRINAWIGEREL